MTIKNRKTGLKGKVQAPLKVRGAFSVRDFAEWAGIGRTTAWALVGRGEIDAFKIGRRTLVAVKAAEEWLASRPLIELSRGR